MDFYLPDRRGPHGNVGLSSPTSIHDAPATMPRHSTSKTAFQSHTSPRFGQRRRRSTHEQETDTDSFHHDSFDPRSHWCRATGSSRTHGEEACLYRQGGLAHDQSSKLPAPWWFYQGGSRGNRAHAGSQGRSQSRK